MSILSTSLPLFLLAAPFMVTQLQPRWIIVYQFWVRPKTQMLPGLSFGVGVGSGRGLLTKGLALGKPLGSEQRRESRGGADAGLAGLWGASAAF